MAGGEEEMTGNGYRASSGCDAELVVMVAQLCECTKTHHTVHFKGMNCVVYELYLKIAVFFLKKLVNTRLYLKHIYNSN